MSRTPSILYLATLGILRPCTVVTQEAPISTGDGQSWGRFRTLLDPGASELLLAVLAPLRPTVPISLLRTMKITGAYFNRL